MRVFLAGVSVDGPWAGTFLDSFFVPFVCLYARLRCNGRFGCCIGAFLLWQSCFLMVLMPCIVDIGCGSLLKPWVRRIRIYVVQATFGYGYELVVSLDKVVRA